MTDLLGLSEEQVAGGEDDQTNGLTRQGFLLRSGSTIAAAGLFGSLAETAWAADRHVAAAAKIPKSKQVYYWVTENVGDPFYVPGIAGMNAFAKTFGVKVQVVGPTDLNMAKSAEVMQTILAKPDTAGIFSYFTDSKVNGPSYAAAFKQRIPIVNGAGDWGSPRVSVCAFDPNTIPHVAADTIATALNGAGSVGYIGILAGNAPLIAQEKEFEAYLKKTHPKIKFVGKATYDGSNADGLKQYTAFVGAKRPDAMFWGDGNGPAVIDGLYSTAPNVKVMLMGLSSPGLAAVKAGKALGTCDRNTFDEEFWGFMPLYFAVNGGYRGPDTINVNVLSITKSNVDAYVKSPYSSPIAWV